MMDKVFDLKRTSEFIGLQSDQLRILIARGEVTAIQPGGPGGKLYIPVSEIHRLRQPVTPAAPEEK